VSVIEASPVPVGVRKPRAVIIDDHEIVARGLTRVLELDGRVRVLGCASSVAEGRELCRSVSPDVIILDLRLPDATGYKAISEFRYLCPQSRIVVLTAYGAAAKKGAIDEGADVFLTKDLASDKISDSVCALFPDGTVWERFGGNLSRQERKVARLVAVGMSNQEVGSALCISTNTVKTHLKNVLAKLDLRDRVQLARMWRDIDN